MLMVHGVGPARSAADPHHLFVPAEALRRWLVALRRRGFTPVTLDAWLAGGCPRRAVLVTFDDGYAGLVEHAVPVLRDTSTPAAVFVLPGLLGGTSRWMPEMPDEPLLTADGIRALVRAGVDVQPHGWDHTDLTGADPETLRRNTTVAAEAVADLTGRRPTAFAYPYGRHDAPACAAVAAAGLDAAFATHRGHGRYAVPRVDLNATDTDRTVRLKSWRAYPAARRLTGTLPGLRPALHTLLGRATRG